MVGRHEVKNAAAQALLDAAAVAVGAERRVHAVETFEGRYEVVCQGQVVRGGVGCDVGPVA